MHLKITGSLLASMLLSITGCAGGADDGQASGSLNAQEAAASQCVKKFEGITSCALGRAKVDAVADGLAVSNLTTQKDGVSSSFTQAVKWEQRVATRLGAQGGYQLSARDGDQVVSTLKVTPGREANTVNILPTFTGSPGGSAYRMNIYRGGVLQGSSPQPAGLMITFTNWRDFLRWAEMNHHFLNDFDIDGLSTGSAETNVGACVWRLDSEKNTFTVDINGKSVTGDSVEFIETVADGAYPYRHFTGIDTNAIAGEYTIRSESITQPTGVK
ncbi:hypothetical protein HJC22_41560 [Corallococcus exiguus]|uniref:hypothetical protein n=1 Tax=Corallococcus TaxID=83461 RepID=UPI000EA14D70|nr:MULTISPECIES: hypothetical protein [Corallococcus]NNC22197.1 hypothetical protein [Corallococcus exiguus]NRD51810.1 hypothetical protein [Corallococcus exiguus]RKH12970.1 hypothetical protein D7V77_40870 [Corallococcus sp. CA041A]RKI20403.1 hypothetical protein D7Y15_01090 [Corallococcus sp. AB030]RUO91825.1 hypothetical protein D7Y11_18085 [Corallococcus sp. AB018]